MVLQGSIAVVTAEAAQEVLSVMGRKRQPVGDRVMVECPKPWAKEKFR